MRLLQPAFTSSQGVWQVVTPKQSFLDCVKRYTHPIGDDCCRQGNFNSVLIFKPPPDMLCSITTPPSLAGQGGYIVSGLLQPGHGVETVHLKLSDFKPDEEVIVHLSNTSDTCLVAARMTSKGFINELIHAKKSISDNNAFVEHPIDGLCEACKLPDSSTFTGQSTTEDPATRKQVAQVIEHRLSIAVHNQALYGTPTRLSYVSDHASLEQDPRHKAYFQNVRELCLVKLKEVIR